MNFCSAQLHERHYTKSQGAQQGVRGMPQVAKDRAQRAGPMNFCSAQLHERHYTKIEGAAGGQGHAAGGQG